MKTLTKLVLLFIVLVSFTSAPKPKNKNNFAEVYFMLYSDTMGNGGYCFLIINNGNDDMTLAVDCMQFSEVITVQPGYNIVMIGSNAGSYIPDMLVEFTGNKPHFVLATLTNYPVRIN